VIGEKELANLYLNVCHTLVGKPSEGTCRGKRISSINILSIIFGLQNLLDMLFERPPMCDRRDFLLTRLKILEAKAKLI